LFAIPRTACFGIAQTPHNLKQRLDVRFVRHALIEEAAEPGSKGAARGPKMHTARKDIAIRAFEELGIAGRNRMLAVYWLSLWDGDSLPSRAQFQPGAVRDLLPGIGIFLVRPGVSAHCRLAGTAITRALGRDLTGRNWQDYTPQPEWKLRLERNSAIATGSVGIGIRSGEDALGHPERVVELQLPFADRAEDGTHQILFHLDWRAPQFAPRPAPTPEGPRVADAFHAVALS
jgi:hypothetical protein